MMDFVQVEQEVAKLRQDLAAGRLTEDACKARMRELMVEDSDGNWWMVGYETGEWYCHDGTDWVRADPPGCAVQQATPKPLPQPVASTEPKPHPFRGILVFVLYEIVIITIGFVLAVVLANLFFDGRDNLISWICLIGVSLWGLVPSYRSSRKAWRGK
jgi:hypothetical protein